LARLLQVGTVAITLRTFLLPIADHFTKKGWRVHFLGHRADIPLLVRAARATLLHHDQSAGCGGSAVAR